MYCTVLYCTVLYCTVLYCTVLYCTVLYCIVLCRVGPPGDGGGHAAVECAGGGDQAEDGDPSTIPGYGKQAEGGH